MSTATEQFFNALADRGYEPLLHRANGSVRVDLDHNEESWYLDVAKGKVKVSRRADDANCTVRSDRATFERVASGQTNALAAMLRNEIMFEGEPTLLVLLQKLFPWPTEGPTS
jgi:putative sterol carrier protein